MRWISTGLLMLLAGCATSQEPLNEALTDWAYRTGYQIVVEPCDATERPARDVKGVSPQDELEQLIDGTGLRYRVVNPRTVAIICP